MIFYCIYFLISPILYLLIYIFSLFNNKIFYHLKSEKKILIKVLQLMQANNKKKVLLFHAASSGEFEQLKPILANINRKQYFVVQSFTSPTVYNAESRNNLFDICCYHPYDIWWKSYLFFSKIKPAAYIITRHDIWPFHILIANYLKIKIIYINVNIHKNSIWAKRGFQALSRLILKNIHLFVLPSKRIQKQVKFIIPNNKIMINHDSRFSQVYSRYLINKDKSYLPKDFSSSDNIIFGSYDYKDEPMIIDSIMKIFNYGDKSLIAKNKKIILVPHEVNYTNIHYIRRKLQQNDFSVDLLSQLKNNKMQPTVLIVDCVGILADLYKYAKLAYVGGGFSKGVHSILEPGIYGCAIGFGPKIELLDELKDIYNNDMGIMIRDSVDMVNFLNLDIQKTQTMGEKVKNFIINKKSSAETLLNIIEKHI